MDENNLIPNLLNYESKNKLDSIFFNDFPIWFLIREEIFTSIILNDPYLKSLEKINLQNSFSISFKKGISIFRSIVKSVIDLKIRKYANNVDILAVSYNWSRKKELKRFKDLYYDPIFDLKNTSYNYILELPAFNTNVHYFNDYKPSRVLYGDYLYFQEIFSTSKYDVDEYVKIFTKICYQLYEKYLDTNIDIKLLESNIKKRFKKYFLKITIIEKFINKINFNKLFVTSAYSPTIRILIHFAKKRNIPVYEFQHSHIYYDHVGYNFPLEWKSKIKNLPIPDKLYLFGDYYRNLLLDKRFWGGNELVTVGNPLLVKNAVSVGKIMDIDKKKYDKVILIISQFTLTDKFVVFLKNCKDYKNILFLIKTHPRDSHEKMIYKTHFGKLENVKIISEGNLIDFFNISDVAISVYSSGIIDAINIGIRTFLLEIEENKLFRELVKKNYTKEVTDIEDLLNKINIHNNLSMLEPLSIPYQPNNIIN